MVWSPVLDPRTLTRAIQRQRQPLSRPSPGQYQLPATGPRFTAYPIIGGAVGTPPKPTIFWSSIPPRHTLDRDIHVDSVAGSDAQPFGHIYGDGTVQGSSARPFLTIGIAKTEMRDTFGDRMWLRRGQTHAGNFLAWSSSGNSIVRPMVVAAYGTGARPIIDTGGVGFFSIQYHNIEAHFWIFDCEITASAFVGAGEVKCINLSWPFTDMLVENCYIHNYSYGVSWDAFSDDITWNANPRHSNLRLRGCVIADCYANNGGPGTGPNCTGLYAASIDTLYVEYVTFDKCGWNDLVGGSGDNGFRRAIYSQTGPQVATWVLPPLPAPQVYHLENYGGCSDIHYIGNIATRTDGYQFRQGGEVLWNLGSRIKSGITLGYGYDPDPAGVSFNCQYNVMLEMRKNAAYNEYPIAYNLTNIRYPSTFSNNIVSGILDDTTLATCLALWIRETFELGIHWPVIGSSLEMDRNIFYYAGRMNVGINNAGQYVGPWNFTNNDFQLLGRDYANITFGDPPFLFGNTSVTAIMSGEGNSWYAQPVLGLPTEPNWFNVNSAVGNPLSTAEFSALIGDGTFSNVAKVYPDPNRTLASYSASIGGPVGHDAFCDLLRTNERDNYDVRLTASYIIEYIRAGFGL